MVRWSEEDNKLLQIVTGSLQSLEECVNFFPSVGVLPGKFFTTWATGKPNICKTT